MAYKQRQGRGNMPKTGRNISPALMSNSPMKQTEGHELTEKGAKSRKKALESIPEVNSNENNSQGIVVDPQTGITYAKPFEKKYIGGRAESSDKSIPTGKRENAMIIDGSGRMVKSADRAKGKSNEALYKEFQKDSTATMDARNRNARFFNLQTGKAKNVTEAELKSGKSRSFYK